MQGIFIFLSLRNRIKRKSLSFNNLGIFYCPYRTSWPTFWPKFDPVLDPLLTHFWPTFFSEKLILRWNDFFMSRYFTSFLYTENHYIIGFLLLADLNLCYQSLSYHWFLTRIYSLLYSPVCCLYSFWTFLPIKCPTTPFTILFGRLTNTIGKSCVSFLHSVHYFAYPQNLYSCHSLSGYK